MYTYCIAANTRYEKYFVSISRHLLCYDTIYNTMTSDKAIDKGMLKDLRTIRMEKGLSLRDLENLSKVSRSSINKIENSKNAPRLCIVCRLARGLEMPPEELFLALISGENY